MEVETFYTPTAAHHPDSSANKLRSALLLIAPLALVVALMFVALNDARLDPASWLPLGLFGSCLLLVTLLGKSVDFGGISTVTWIGICLLTGFVAWSFFSVTWANDKGAAIDGSLRALLYLLILLLTIGTLRTTKIRTTVLAIWTIGMITLGVLVLIWLPDPPGSNPAIAGPGLAWPLTYSNANAAFWNLALWPAVAIVGQQRLSVLLRAVSAGGAVVLINLIIASQSRGAIFGLAAGGLLMIALAPGRSRMVLALVPILAGTAVTARQMINTGDVPRPEMAAKIADLAPTVLTSALAVAVVVAIALVFEQIKARRNQDARSTRSSYSNPNDERLLSRIALVICVVAVAAGSLAAGNPAKVASDAWNSFANDQGFSDQAHLKDGLGGERWRFFDAGKTIHAENQVRGTGADSFGVEYLKYEQGGETPQYAHSLYYGTLSQLGFVGVALLGGAAFALLIAAFGNGLRARGTVAAVGVSAGIVAMGSWFAHGLVDWLWEIPALGAIAFFLLGIALSVGDWRRIDTAGRLTDLPIQSELTKASNKLAISQIIGVLLSVAAMAIFAIPWLAQLNLNRAPKVATSDPELANQILDSASSLNPYTAQPALFKASFALNKKDYPAAATSFAAALDKNPKSLYALLQLGAINAIQKEPVRARQFYRRALAIHPKNALARQGLNSLKLPPLLTPEAIIKQYESTAIQQQGRELDAKTMR